VEDCCTVKPAAPTSPILCPECGKPGRPVERITVKAMLRPGALMRLSAPEHRFCPTPACSVVYFGIEEVFHREEIVVPVFQKEPAGERTVCYCFAVTEADLRRELEQTGHSTATAEISEHVRADRCACELKNPQGSCCLGNVATAVREALYSSDCAARRAQASTGPGYMPRPSTTTTDTARARPDIAPTGPQASSPTGSRMYIDTTTPR